MYILYVYWICADNYTFQEAQICVEYEFFIIYIKLQDISRTTLIIVLAQLFKHVFCLKSLLYQNMSKRKPIR